jgi:hypothetical protein
MKKVIVLSLILAVALVSCDALYSPTEAPVQPTPIPPTAEVVVVTVEVPVEASPAGPTPIPTVTPLPPQPTEAPTQEPQAEPTQEVAASTQPAAPTAQPVSGPINVEPSLLGGVFANVSTSGDRFSLRCNPKEISFDITASDIYITQVDLYYRIRDKHSNDIPSWSYAATMETDGGDHFWLTYSGESVTPNNRKAQGWFDFQVVGVNKYGDVIGRTDHIEGLITYTIDC